MKKAVFSKVLSVMIAIAMMAAYLPASLSINLSAFAKDDTIYVSASGDANGDGSESNPYATIAAGVAALKSGGTLVIKDGTYNEPLNVAGLSATADQPTTIKADGDAIITGSTTTSWGSDYTGSAVLSDDQNIVIDGLTFDYKSQGTTYDSILYVIKTSGVTIKNCTFKGDGDKVVAAIQPDSQSAVTSRDEDVVGTIDGNVFENVKYGIWFAWGRTGWDIINNIFKNDIGIEFAGDGSSTAYQTVSYNTIANNMFKGTIDGTAFAADQDNVVANNVFGKGITGVDASNTKNTYEYNVYRTASSDAKELSATEKIVTGDLGFVDEANENYALTDDSVLAHAGSRNLYTDHDFAGNDRTTPSDIGVYASNSSSTGVFDLATTFPVDTGASLTTKVSFTIKGALDASITAANMGDYFTVKNTDGAKVEGKYNVNTENGVTEVSFVASSEYAERTKYTATVKAELKDADGAVLGEDYSWNFTTESKTKSANHPSLLFSRTDGTYEQLIASTEDASMTPYGSSTQDIWKRVLTETNRYLDEEYYSDEALRSSAFTNFFYFYYPYVLEPVDWDKPGALQVGDNKDANATATNTFATPFTEKAYNINFDFKPTDPEQAKDYIIYQGLSGDSAKDITLKMTAGKVYYTFGSETNFLDIADLTLKSNTWYNFYISISDNGDIKILVNGKLAKASSVAFGEGDLTGYTLGGLGSGEYDNIRLFNTYKPFSDERFLTVGSNWALKGATERTGDKTHEPTVPVFYWTGISSDLQARLQNLALTYAMTNTEGNEAVSNRYLEKCRQLMLSIANWSVWGDPEKGELASLDISNITTGMAYAYDMTYDGLSDEDRDTIAEAIKTKGVDQIYKASITWGETACYDGKSLPQNTLMVENGAMGVAALAVMDRYDVSIPLDRARENIESAYRNGCDRDGAWAEGAIYGDLAIISALPFQVADRNLTGHDALTSGYLSKIPDFPIYNLLPAGAGYSAIADNSYNYAYQYKKIMEYYTKYGVSEYSGWILDKLGSVKYSSDMLSFVWHPGHIEPKAPSNSTKMLAKLFNDMGLATMKSGWGPTDTMLNLKTSKRSNHMTDHTHLDQNTIELVRGSSALLADPGYQQYSGPARPYTNGTKGHNTFVLDDADQSEYGWGGQMENFFVTDQYAYSVGAAGQAYHNLAGVDSGRTIGDNVPEWRRSVVSIPAAGYYVLFDDYQTNEDNRDLKWQFNTTGNASKDKKNNSIMIEGLNKSDYLSMKLLNQDISKINVDEAYYVGGTTSAYVTLPNAMLQNGSPKVTIKVNYTAWSDVAIYQYLDDEGNYDRIGDLTADSTFEGGKPSFITSQEITLNPKYYDSVSSTSSTTDVRLDFGSGAFISYITVKCGDQTFNLYSNDEDAAKVRETFGMYYKPNTWRGPYELNGKTVMANNYMQTISMTAPNGKENNNILALLTPSGDALTPDTMLLSDGDDTGVVVSRNGEADGILDGQLDVVLFHKDSTTPVVLANAKSYNALGTVTTQKGYATKVVVKYKADKDTALMQDDVQIGTLVGDGKEHVDAYTLQYTGNASSTLSADNVTVLGMWAAPCEKLVDVTPGTDVEVQNPDSYYDLKVTYKNATAGATVKQNGVVIGTLPEGDGFATVSLMKPYNESITSAGRRIGTVNITVDGATVDNIKLAEDGTRGQIGRTLNVGGDNDTEFVDFNAPGINVCAKTADTSGEPDTKYWTAKSTEDGLNVRTASAGAPMFVNTMNTRNGYRVYFKYKASSDVPIYQYSDTKNKTLVGTLPASSEWRVYSMPLRNYSYNFSSYNYLLHRKIEIGGEATINSSWLELEDSDTQLDLNDLTKNTYNNAVKHNVGIVAADGFDIKVEGGGRNAADGAKFYINIDNSAKSLSRDYYLTINTTTSVGAKIMQTTSNGDVEIGTLPKSGDAATTRVQLDKDYVDSLADTANTNIAITLVGANTTISDVAVDFDNTLVEQDKLPVMAGYDSGSKPSRPNGGGTSTNPGPTGPTGPTKPEVKDETIVKPDVTANNNKAIADMSEADIVTAISKANAANKDITIIPNVTGDADTVGVTIPASAIREASDKLKGNIVVKTGAAEITLDKAALKDLADKGGNVVVSTTKDGDEVTVSVKAGGEDVDLKDILVSIPTKTKGNGNVAVSGDTILKNSIVDGDKVLVRVAAGTKVGVKDNSKKFNDIASHWAKEYIDFATARELFAGVSEDEFGPDVKMTRGMFVTVLGRYAGAKGVKDAGFTDVVADAYYADYVNWAAENGIVSGVGEGTFAPNATITREQLCVMIYNFAKYAKIDLTGEGNTNFSDSDKISSWAKEAVEALAKSGIVKGRNGGAFDPQGQASRAEVATIFANLIASIVK